MSTKRTTSSRQLGQVLALLLTAATLAAPASATAKEKSTDCHYKRAPATDSARVKLFARSAHETSCATAATVLHAMSRWADPHKRDLGAKNHGLTRGYRCTAKLVGNPAWDVTCTRGNRTIRAATKAPVKTKQKRSDCHGETIESTDPAKLRFALTFAEGTSCATAAKVFQAVVDWADETKTDLGAQTHGPTFGYKCSVRSTGDYSWEVTCRRSGNIIRAATAR